MTRPRLRFIRLNSVWAQIEKDAHTPADFGCDPAETKAWYALLHMTLAIGCTYSYATGDTSSNTKTAEMFYERSCRFLPDYDTERGSIALIQCLNLRTLYLQTTDQVNKVWNITGVAIRTAQAIGLTTDSPSESQLQREERRRTWWYCTLMDR